MLVAGLCGILSIIAGMIWAWMIGHAMPRFASALLTIALMTICAGILRHSWVAHAINVAVASAAILTLVVWFPASSLIDDAFSVSAAWELLGMGGFVLSLFCSAPHFERAF